MRVLWLMPLTFVAGIHGFGLFVPYLFVIAGIVTLRRRAALKPAAPRAVDSEFEAAAA